MFLSPLYSEKDGVLFVTVCVLLFAMGKTKEKLVLPEIDENWWTTLDLKEGQAWPGVDLRYVVRSAL